MYPRILYLAVMEDKKVFLRDHCHLTLCANIALYYYCIEISLLREEKRRFYHLTHKQAITCIANVNYIQIHHFSFYSIFTLFLKHRTFNMIRHNIVIVQPTLVSAQKGQMHRPSGKPENGGYHYQSRGILRSMLLSTTIP